MRAKIFTSQTDVSQKQSDNETAHKKSCFPHTHTQTDVWSEFLKKRHAVRLESLVMRTSMKCWQPTTGAESGELRWSREQVNQSEGVLAHTA